MEQTEPPKGTVEVNKGGTIRSLLRLVAVVVIALLLHPAPHLNPERIVRKVHVTPISQPVQQDTAKVVEAVSAVAPKPKVVRYPRGCETYRPIVSQYKWNVHVAMAIMRAESGCNPYAISPARLNYDHVSDYGLFQIHGQYVINPNRNIAVAYHKYQTQGWRAWSSYKSGKYLTYL